jgi:hypothetical protein
MTSAAARTVIASRRVMYIPGYDPFAPRTYRERYRRQAARQAAISGHEIALGPRRAKDGYGWHVEARIEGAVTQNDFAVLVWSDLVRDSMQQGVLATYGQLVRTAWAYIGSGALFRLMRLRKGPVIAALYPVVVLMLQGLVALALGYGGYRAITVAGSALADWGRFALVLSGAGFAFGAMILLAFLTWCQRRDDLLAWYLMHDYAFCAQHLGAYPEAQEARMADFAETIAAALASDTDEVLIVGHSSGAYIAISVLADLIRAGRVPKGGPVLSLLTLGHVVPMASFLPRADRLRGDLALLAASDALSWVDVSAPGDVCCFALCDPVAVTGVAPPDKRWPLVISAAFTRTLRPETWRALRWRYVETHFQYLNAFDNLKGGCGEYDYFRTTAGPLSLGARYAGRAPSPARIERVINRHRSRAA